MASEKSIGDWVSDWVSDCCLTPFSNFSVITWREQINFQWDDDEVHFVLDQYAKLDFCCASSLKQQSADRHVALLGHIILIQYLIFLLNAACLAEKNKYQFYSLWLDPTGARTHDLPHSRRARWPLRHRGRWLETFTSRHKKLLFLWMSSYK